MFLICTRRRGAFPPPSLKDHNVRESEYGADDAESPARALPVARWTCGFEKGSLPLCDLPKGLPPVWSH